MPLPSPTPRRLPWILVLLLVALNLTVLAVLWLRPQGCGHPPGRGDGPPHHGGPPPRGGLPRELGMNAEEMRRVEGIQDMHFQRMEVFRDQIIALRKQAFQDFGEARVDTAAAMAALDSIGAVQVAAEKERFAHFLEILALCTPAQAQRFREILPEVLSRGRQPENHPPGPHGSHPHGH